MASLKMCEHFLMQHDYRKVSVNSVKSLIALDSLKCHNNLSKAFFFRML